MIVRCSFVDQRDTFKNMEKETLSVVFHTSVVLLTLQQFNSDIFSPKQTRSPFPVIPSSYKNKEPISYMVIGSSTSATNSGASQVAQGFGLFAMAVVFPVLMVFSILAYVARLRAEKDNGKVAKF